MHRYDSSTTPLAPPPPAPFERFVSFLSGSGDQSVDRSERNNVAFTVHHAVRWRTLMEPTTPHR